METPDEFARLGIALVAVADGVDTTDATTRDMARDMAGALLRAERIVRSERSTASLDDARENGTKPGRPPDRPRLQIDRNQIPALPARGISPTAIAQRLGVSIGLVRHECAKHHQSAGLIPTPAHRSEAVLTTAASAVASLQALEPRAAQSEISFGNAPYRWPGVDWR